VYLFNDRLQRKGLKGVSIRDGWGGGGEDDIYENTDVLAENVFHCHFLHLKSSMNWPGVEQGHPL